MSETHQNGGRSSRAKSRSGSNYDDYTASKYEMLQKGVPDDYVNALLDDEYMERLVKATDAIMTRRKRHFDNYLMLNKIILAVLIIQALFGVLIALIKALSPDHVYNTAATIPDVNLVLMLDASDHMLINIDSQHTAAITFTNELIYSLKDRQEKLKQEAHDDMEKMQDANNGVYIPLISDIIPKAEGKATVTGGSLSPWAGIFNADNTGLWPFQQTSGSWPEVEMQVQLDNVSKAHYGTTARFKLALEQCAAAVCRGEGQYVDEAKLEAGNTDELEKCIENIGHSNKGKVKRFCAIMGDNEAMCQRKHDPLIDNLCKQWGPGYCPFGHSEHGVLLEYGQELQQCTTYVENYLQPLDMSVVLMFTTGSREESQYRLRSYPFRQFVEQMTGCSIVESDDPDDRNAQGFLNYKVQDGCTNFMLAKDFTELAEKAKAFANSLKGDINTGGTKINDDEDRRFLFFLLLPLNLLFYVLWTRILKWYTSVKKRVQKIVGSKKKMIKVTKKVVEKPQQQTIVDQAAAMTELELADVHASRPQVQMGDSMTLRARLKGGFVRANQEWACLDGHGQPYSADAYWSFEPVLEEGEVEGEYNMLYHGRKVRLKGGLGHYMTCNELGSGLDGKKGDDAAEFEVELVDDLGGDDATVHLGDNIRLKCKATDQFLRVHKDGSVDATGEAKELETQIAIDRGGDPIQSGSIVRLHAAANKECVCCTEGDGGIIGVAAADSDAKEGFESWLIEKKVEQASCDSTGEGYDNLLKDGDVVTLRCLLDTNLEVDAAGKCGCGRKVSEATSSTSGASGTLNGTVQEFVVERMGMNLTRKKDNLIRNGGEITLRPLNPGPLGEQCIRVDASAGGAMTANGRPTDVACCFNIEQISLQRMASPIRDVLDYGDAEITCAAVWNKSDVKNIKGMAAPWTKNEDLEKSFKGQVVLANKNGQYVVPKQQGEGDIGWVAVVHEGVDVKKAAQQAKQQGASGMIVRCQGGLSINKLSEDGGGEDLVPTMFVDHKGGQTLDERGLQLKSGQVTQKNFRDAMKVLGKLGNNRNQVVTKGDFAAVAKAVIAGSQKKPLKADSFTESEPDTQSDDPSQSNYKWKVSSNTHYLWTRSGGGATKMDVNFGKKAPPSAMKKMKLDAEGREIADSSQDFNTVVAPKQTFKKKKTRLNSLVGVAILEESAVSSQSFSQEMDVVAGDDWDWNYADYGQDQLADDSDFRIEYTFEEVEVAANAKAEDIEGMEEEELLDDQADTVVGALTVPASHFWMVAGGLICSTILLFGFLFYMLSVPPEAPSQEPLSSATAADYHSVGPDFTRLRGPGLHNVTGTYRAQY